MKKLGLLVMPLMAISLLASCNNGGGGDKDEYLTFTCASKTGTLSIEARTSGYGELPDIDLEFSTNKTTWTQVPDFTAVETPVEICTLNKNESVYLRGNNLTGLSSDESYVNFVTPTIENADSDFNVSGNVLSLVDKDDYAAIKAVPGEYCFKGLFYKANIIDASNLILSAKALPQGTYYTMFLACTKLTKAPKLEATSFSDGCYKRMFTSCTSLKVYEGNGTQENTFLTCPDTFQSDDYAGSMFMNSGGEYKDTPRAGYSYYYTL
ncbi:MAG: hypothetical protein MJ206_01575 [Bacilli bacterium]|nr:hypothetical protein [Bacilli bacterium]